MPRPPCPAHLQGEGWAAGGATAATPARPPRCRGAEARRIRPCRAEAAEKEARRSQATATAAAAAAAVSGTQTALPAVGWGRPARSKPQRGQRGRRWGRSSTPHRTGRSSWTCLRSAACHGCRRWRCSRCSAAAGGSAKGRQACQAARGPGPQAEVPPSGKCEHPQLLTPHPRSPTSIHSALPSQHVHTPVNPGDCGGTSLTTVDESAGREASNRGRVF